MTELSAEMFGPEDRDQLAEIGASLLSEVHDIDFHNWGDGWRPWQPEDGAATLRDLRHLVDRLYSAAVRARTGLADIEAGVGRRGGAGGQPSVAAMWSILAAAMTLGELPPPTSTLLDVGVEHEQYAELELARPADVDAWAVFLGADTPAWRDRYPAGTGRDYAAATVWPWYGWHVHLYARERPPSTEDGN